MRPTFRTRQTPATSDSPACPVCSSPAAGSFTARGSPLCGRELRFHRCATCGLQFQEANTDEDGSIYLKVEVAREEQGHGGGPSLVLDADALRLLRRISPGLRLLDVGSGDGRFLLSAAAAGFTAVGTDISPELAEIARRRSHCEVHVGALESLRLPDGSFDAANLDLVLMYVPSPVSLLSEVARLLAPGGVCRIRECFGDSLNARVQRERWWFYCDSTLRVYTRRALCCLAEQVGLSPLRWFAGTEVSLQTWSRYAARKKNRNALRQLVQFGLKRATLCGIPVAGDGTCYLRKKLSGVRKNTTRSA